MHVVLWFKRLNKKQNKISGHLLNELKQHQLKPIDYAAVTTPFNTADEGILFN